MSATDPTRIAPSLRRDLGRWVGIPLTVLLLAASVAAVLGERAQWTTTSPLEHVHRLLVLAFYGLLLWAYMRRVAATAGSRSVTARVAAGVATVLPAALPLATAAAHSGWGVAVGSVVTLAGLTWSVVALRTLGRAFSVMPQARTLVSHGPYAVVRHPLYSGELLASLGLVASGPTPAAAAIWAALAFLQCYRAQHEEQVLAAALPGYSSYRRNVPYRVVPGVW